MLVIIAIGEDNGQLGHTFTDRFYYGLNLTDDPGNANFRSPIKMHYIRMIKYYYV